MSKITLSIALTAVFVLSYTSRVHADNGFSEFASDLGHGYQNVYSPDNLPWLGKTLLVGGIFANTDLDQEIQDSYNSNILSQSSNDFSEITKTFGDTAPTAIYFGLAALNRLACERDCGPVPEWGDRTAQALLVGLPAVWASQAILGGARPRHGVGSEWNIFEFEYEHTVSGHAYVGAVPFLTAAQMTDNPYAKAVFYGLSPLTGISRMNDQKHYFSQVLMGWLYAAKVTEVINGNLQPDEALVLPYADEDTVLLSVIKPF
ncbi:phosphatase PAP2 family protein [Oceanospirillum sp.]|uniref:phosphatase PAP2 family protein n=1 Tax=Oceanospirillum sp. TaxID=2021254 RepID=UPI003A8CB2E1